MWILHVFLHESWSVLPYHERAPGRILEHQLPLPPGPDGPVAEVIQVVAVRGQGGGGEEQQGRKKHHDAFFYNIKSLAGCIC